MAVLFQQSQCAANQLWMRAFQFCMHLSLNATDPTVGPQYVTIYKFHYDRYLFWAQLGTLLLETECVIKRYPLTRHPLKCICVWNDYCAETACAGACYVLP